MKTLTVVTKQVRCDGCGRLTFRLLSKSVSRSRAWAVYGGSFLGVYQWKGKGGLYKSGAAKILARQFPKYPLTLRAVVLIGEG